MSREALRAFCEGYAFALKSERDFVGGGITHTDDWIVWREYDINIYGAELDADLTSRQLRVAAYPAGWRDNLREPLYYFVVGEFDAGEADGME